MTQESKIIFLYANLNRDRSNAMELVQDLYTIEQLLELEKMTIMLNQFAPGVRKRQANKRDVMERLLEQRIVNN